MTTRTTPIRPTPATTLALYDAQYRQGRAIRGALLRQCARFGIATSHMDTNAVLCDRILRHVGK